MSDRVALHVVAADPISRLGLTAQLRGLPGLEIVDEPDRADVAVVAADTVDEDATRAVRTLLRGECTQVVLVATVLDDQGVLAAAEAGVCAILRRSEASPERLATVVTSAAHGHGTLPPDLLGSLLSQVGKLQRNVLEPRGLRFNGFTQREVEVLRLIADGHDTNEIADQLAYSERTVKNVIHDVTSRFNLRNRSHAVAYALRAGVI